MSGGLRRSNRPPVVVLPMSWSSAPEDPGPSVSVAWLSRPREGESVNGDAVVVRRHGDAVLVAVVDALGHGPKAAEVAEASAEWLAAAHDVGGAPSLIAGLPKHLQGTRGAAARLLVISSTGLEACSVGNVELRSATGKLPFVLTPGVLGVRLRQPKICVSPSLIADRFVLHSDGISGRFDIKAHRSHAPPAVATQIFGAHRHAHDDATVVVVDVA